MALDDDLRRLAAEDVLYLSLSALTSSGGPFPEPSASDAVSATVVYRGRLRQALNGNWVFNTSTGTNGVAGILLGPSATDNSWASSESPASGLQLTIMVPPATQAVIVIGTVIPTDLAT